MAKQVVLTENGTRVRMNEAALLIAEEHFGVTKSRPVIKETPIELLQRPQKIEIIKANTPEIKLPVAEIPKIPEVKIIKPPVAKVVVVKKKVIRKKK